MARPKAEKKKIVKADAFMHNGPEYKRWLAEDRAREDAEALAAQPETEDAEETSAEEGDASPSTEEEPKAKKGGKKK